MASSFRSHFRPPSRQDESNSTLQRKPSSRLPTRSITPTSEPTKGLQHVSRLAKRPSSREATTSDKARQSSSRTERQPGPVTGGHNYRTATPNGAVAQPSAPSSAGIPPPPAFRHHDFPVPLSARTPSLVSGSTASTVDSARSTVLRRKPSMIDRYAAQKRGESAASQDDRTTVHNADDLYKDSFADSVLGISLPPAPSDKTTNAYAPTQSDYRSASSQYHKVQLAAQHLTRDVTPPNPSYAQSATPSTRYSDSPFSHVPTPSSASSYSPGIVATANEPQRQRQPSPTRSRPPVTRNIRKPEDKSRLGLPPVRESSTSSSGSTIKPDHKTAPARKEIPRRVTPSSALSANNSTAVHRKPVPVTRDAAKKDASVQIPPELAHLNVELPPNTQKPLPPVRPSRDGTVNLMDRQGPFPVVQSNLPPLYTSYHKRTPSQETPLSAASPASKSKSRFGFSSKPSSRQASPRVDSAISPPPSAKLFARGPTPDYSANDGPRLLRKDSPAVVLAPSPSKSPRFPFFSRKPKTGSSNPVEKPERKPRKGPAAGTGHEGYGRFGFRGRSGSTTSSTSVGRSPSADSTSSSVTRPTTSRKSSLISKEGSDLDDFLKDRLTPVILRGNGSISSSQGSNADLPSMHFDARNNEVSSSDPSLDSLPQPQLLPPAMQKSNVGTSPAKRPVIGFRNASESSEDDVAARYPTLAARRSFNRSLQADDKVPLKVPPPINTNLPSKTSSMDSYEAEISAWPQTDSSLPPEREYSEGGEGIWLKSKQAEQQPKPAKKWNFFQRAHSSPQKGKGKERATVEADVPEVLPHQSPYKTVAHYAMLDPSESVGLDEVEQIMQENETSAEDSMQEENAPPRVVPYERRHTSLLPSPPKPEFSSKDSAFRARPTPPRIMIRQDSADSPELLRAQPMVKQLPNLVDIPRSPVTVHSSAPSASPSSAFVPVAGQSQTTTPEMLPSISTPEMQQTSNSPRPRLSPVGRIPRVVSRRDRDRKLSDNSFSRPFARTQPRPTVKPPGSLYNQIRDLASPIESQSQPVSSTSGRSGRSDSASAEVKGSYSSTDPSSVSAVDRTSMEAYAAANKDFLSFQPRKDSDVSYSSSSGIVSFPNSMFLQQSQDDDIWNEYDDLMDDVMLQKTPISAGSSLGAPFQYANMLNDSHSPSLPTPLKIVPKAPVPPPSELPPPPRSSTVPAVLSVPQQIARFLQPVGTPNTPYSISDFVAGYGDRTASMAGSFQRQSGQSGHRVSTGSARGSIPSSRHSRVSGHSRTASLPEASSSRSHHSLTPSARSRNTQLLDIAESDKDESAVEANLRFGALMTSKWLSFGRVLFSPAHNEMTLADEPRVLVIDGLGNDWSYYCAMSYPSSTIYNLAPASASVEPSLPMANWKSLRNHKHIPHPSISSPFPFPKGFFTAVVFRFPVAASDQSYHACICECKRVLRPGGHLEISVLDLDLMNMGNRARKAVRGLKTRVQQRNEDVSLRNMGDVMMRLVGRRGFEEVQRCVVGVPVAGRIPQSQDLSSISSGHSGSKPIWDREQKGDGEAEFSFADLIQDVRSSRFMSANGNDEGITKMVAKVGRWWYSTCYESALLGTDRSIFNDRALLRECEKQGTSFRLLICYAQKPMCAMRRTVSV